MWGHFFLEELMFPGFLSLCPWCSGTPRHRDPPSPSAHTTYKHQSARGQEPQGSHRSSRSWIHISSSLLDRSVLAHVQHGRIFVDIRKKEILHAQQPKCLTPPLESCKVWNIAPHLLTNMLNFIFSLHHYSLHGRTITEFNWILSSTNHELHGFSNTPWRSFSGSVSKCAYSISSAHVICKPDVYLQGSFTP